MKALLVLALLSIPVAADAMPDSTKMSCAQATATVSNAGAVVMTYGHFDGGCLYDRFVAHGGYCMHGETTEAAWVPTTDSADCFVGYRCVSLGGGGE